MLLWSIAGLWDSTFSNDKHACLTHNLQLDGPPTGDPAFQLRVCFEPKRLHTVAEHDVYQMRVQSYWGSYVQGDYGRQYTETNF